MIIFGVFRVKNHDFTPKNHIFSNFRGGGASAGCAPWIRSWPVLPVSVDRPFFDCPFGVLKRLFNVHDAFFHQVNSKPKYCKAK